MLPRANVEVENNVKHIGSVVDTHGRTTQEIASRIGASNKCYDSLMDLMQKQHLKNNYSSDI